MTLRIRQLVLLVGLTPGLLFAQRARPHKRTYVIVHGAWGGGWDWRGVDSALSARGNRVYRVTLAGLGDKVHLASPSIGLATHVSDVVNTICFENLRDVILVGHSYGGMVITGAADQVADRIHRLVYVDAFLPDSGESLATLAGAGFNQMVTANARDGMIVPPWVPADAPPPKDVPHPLKTMLDTLVLTNPAGRALPVNYILTMNKGATSDDFSPSADRAIARNFPIDTLITDHTPERSAIPGLVRILLRVR